MELPIDHFRLLGVNPTSDAQAVLHALQQRLDRPPAQGFTAETLAARAELLRTSADLLSDPERRAAYEASLTTLAAREPQALATLDITSNLELGGLLLLLEAGLAQECYERAERHLQPPQAPALGSGREADLALLAGLACLAAAADLHRQRRYEQAAQTLQQGLQLLQRTGQQPLLRQQLQDELEGLRPFRVLDLLSRDLTADAERSEGLGLLDALVQRRGGLEGQEDPRLPPEDFQAFFRQIRSFLTVQEQVDLFIRWGDHSKAAQFLATTALTASGFARRKPEQIAAALTRLEGGSQSGTEPLQACLQLLLGKVDAALALFAAGASPELRQWAEQQSDDPLAQLCAYCRDWLGRDVLPGYRDLEADPDLEAWFADRDVQAYVEQLDPAPAAQQREAGSFFGAWPGSVAPPAPLAASAGVATSLEPLPGLPPIDHPGDAAEASDDDEEREPNQGWPRPRWLVLAAACVALAAGGALLVLRGRQAPPTPIPVQRPTPAARPPARPTAKPPLAPASPARPAAPLTAAEPSEAELKALLGAWLTGKAAVLAGRQSAIPLDAIARASQVALVEQERQADASLGQSLRIETTIRSLAVEQRGPQRIAVIASLNYSDQRLDAAGAPVGQASNLQLRNRYVFARDNDRWLLAGFERAD